VKKLVTTLFAVLAFAGAACAQNDTASEFAFSYRVVGTPIVNNVAPAGTLVFPDTSVGKSSAITLLITSATLVKSDYAIDNLAVTGSGFTAVASPTVPAQGGGFGTVALTFTPTAGGAVNGSVQFTLASPSNQQFNYVFNLFGNGLAPKVITSYISPTTGDQLPVQSGDIVAIPNTPVGSSSSTTFVVSNTGTGSTTVDSVATTGSGFSITNLGLTPATLNAVTDFHFQITFTPLAAQTYTGTLTVSIGGKISTFALTGQGTSSAFTYQLLTGTGNKPIAPGAAIALPDTPADGVSKNTVTIQVTNTGNLDTSLSAVNVTGTDFQLLNLPVLPATLKANGGATLFSIVYQPKAPGVSAGRLQIGNDVFNLTGNALGAQLTFSVNVGTGALALQTGGAIAVPNTTVGGKRMVSVSVTNAGNQPATVSSFSVSGAAFTTPVPMPLPVTLAPGDAKTFSFTFSPTVIGEVTGTLAINDQTFRLIAAGDAPPPLPQVTFTGVQNTTSPLQQPAVGIQLAAPYASDLTGVLTLSFLSDSFADDPSIEFATGARTLPFTIPANTTQAVFTQLGKSAAFQTGTLSGAVTFSATFTAGAVDITPTALPVKTTVIPQGPPQLRSVRVNGTASTAGSSTIQLLISGYSTTRTVSQLAFQFAGATGTNVTTSALTSDVSSAFTSWYANPGSKVFGSQFTVTIALTVTGDPNALQSISVTASNSQGTSQPVSVTLR
jgi:hypothetical protein